MAILMGIMIIATIATLIIVINVYNKLPKGQRPWNQVKIRDFYLELGDYVGGYLMRLDHRETMGKIENIHVEKDTCGEETLTISCKWTAERELNLNSSWGKYIIEKDRWEQRYFNAFHQESIWGIEKAQIFTIRGDYTFRGDYTLIVDKNGRAYMLFKPDHSLKENDWESIIPNVEE